MSSPHTLLNEMLASRLDVDAQAWGKQAACEIAAGTSDDHFCALLSMASRYARHNALAPTETELDNAEAALSGWNPQHWTLLETLRVSLAMQRPDLDSKGGERALEEAFRYADAGEMCALYRLLPFLPDAARFVWRAGEGCRSNMTSVFEAVACETPYPARHFDDLAWRQLLLKAIFIEVPLWRVQGIDDRHDPELVRMALDFADERRSAGRDIPYDLWLLLGSSPGARGIAALEAELDSTIASNRHAAVLALARAQATDKLQALASSGAAIAQTAREVLAMSTPTPQDFANLPTPGH